MTHKTVLYTGLEPPKRTDVTTIHCPLIQVQPIDNDAVRKACSQITKATHLIVTSKTAVSCLLSLGLDASIWQKPIISVGKATTFALVAAGAKEVYTASSECQEGVIRCIEKMPIQNPLFFWGHSSLSRSVLTEYLSENRYSLIDCVLYETHYKKPALSLDFAQIDEIYFASPSTVEAFFHFFGPPTKRALLTTQGPVTKACLDRLLFKTSS